MLLSTAYFPPISWFAAIAEDFTLSPDKVKSSCVWLEAHENYQKQTYRNRCVFYSSQGPEMLNVPIVHGGAGGSRHGIKIPITEVMVDYSTDWLHRTRRAIVSAYMTSAYFEYYQDDLFAILDARPERLWDLNLELIQFFLQKIGLQAEFHETEAFVPPCPQSDPSGLSSREQELALQYGTDHRFDIHPKKPDRVLASLGLDRPYFQVFAPKYGFQPNLSIMDLLFNEGPDAILYLKNKAAVRTFRKDNL